MGAPPHFSITIFLILEAEGEIVKGHLQVYVDAEQFCPPQLPSEEVRMTEIIARVDG